MVDKLTLSLTLVLFSFFTHAQDPCASDIAQLRAEMTTRLDALAAQINSTSKETRHKISEELTSLIQLTYQELESVGSQVQTQLQGVAQTVTPILQINSITQFVTGGIVVISAALSVFSCIFMIRIWRVVNHISPYTSVS